MSGQRTAPIASVVVPAHNEESSVGRCLDVLLATALPGELDVVVVANGCTDSTAKMAEQRGVRVVETPMPGKANAIRVGDLQCHTFPRIYLDADIELSTDSVRALVSACHDGALACAPAPAWNLTGTSRLARRVHQVHDLLMGSHRVLAGVGAYVLSEAGHARVFPLPDVVADDEWAHRNFAPGEHVVVTEARSVVRPPRTVPAYLRRRVRIRAGNRQLAALGRPAVTRLGLRSVTGLLADRRASPVDIACYLGVLVIDKALSRVSGTRIAWVTDESSRQ